MIFLSIIDLLSLLVRLSLLKYLHKEIHVHVYPAYHIEYLAFKLDQTLSNERVNDAAQPFNKTHSQKKI